MPGTVLILTEPNDFHAHAVALSLRRRGAAALIWYTTDFPSRATESVLFEEGRERIRLSGVGADDVAAYGISCVWRRRPAYVLDTSVLHVADRKFAEAECHAFRPALFETLLPEAFWVNPAAAAVHASRKLVQHETAIEVGLLTPDTLFSNDPREIRDFIRRHGGQVVYKALRPHSWRDSETCWAPYTSLLTGDQLVADDLVRATPGIYQELVPKAYEVRLTVIGRKLFAAKIFSQDTTRGRLDWRKAYGELRMEPIELPESVAIGCHRLMDMLGIVFGCFDFIVTPAGRHIFLEVNEMGQFIFIEEYTGMPVLDAFSEFLVQGGVDFAWSSADTKVRCRELEDEALAMGREAVATHVTLPDESVDEVLLSQKG